MTWRSLLYVPVVEERFVAKAAQRGADVVILDCEDSIAPARKEEARATLTAAVPRARAPGADVLVRINRPLDLPKVLPGGPPELDRGEPRLPGSSEPLQKRRLLEQDRNVRAEPHLSELPPQSRLLRRFIQMYR